MAAVQQRYTEEDRVDARDWLLRDILQLRRTDLRPSRRISRLDPRHTNVSRIVQPLFLWPSLQSALGKGRILPFLLQLNFSQ